MKKGTRNVIFVSVAVGVVAFGIGFGAGWGAHKSPTVKTAPSWVSTVQKQLLDIDESTILKYVDSVDKDNIRDNLMSLALEPHLSTSDRDEELVKLISGHFNTFLDESEIVTYELLMSFPSQDQVNKKNIATVYNSDGTMNMTTKTTEVVYAEYMKAPETIVPFFNAYAPAGNAMGKLVYANYGSEDDFAFLAGQGVDLNGTIALTKYGRVGRGARTFNAKPYGVIGVLVYSDPEDYTLPGDVGYPNDFSLPPSSVQRGSALGEIGDPSTPNYPSIDSAYRVPEDEIPYFPALPLQPIAYDDAERLIQLLQHNDSLVGPGWSTGLNNGVVNVGPDVADGGYLHLSVNNELRYVHSSNVIGKIKGSSEIDDWVMYGNHRDSLVYGAVDPSSGTASMMEMTRAFGAMLKEGWRPKRTMLFGSWGAEEFGLIGSLEWAQDKAQLLQDRAIAYVNVDIAVFGNQSFYASSSPVMKNVWTRVAKMVKDPLDDSKTVLDSWIENIPGSTEGEPYIGSIRGASSDYAYFYHSLGISVADLSYEGNITNPRYQISPYPTYHTAYDTFDYVDRFVDPGFYGHSTVCKVAGSALLLMADSLIIPFDPRNTAAVIQEQVQNTVTNYGTMFDSDKIGYLQDAGKALEDEAANFMNYIENALDRTNVIDISSVNRRMRLFEKAFIEPAALNPSRITYKHISASYFGARNGGFPSIDGLLYDVDNPSSAVMTEAKQALAMITYRILNAADVLNIWTKP